MRNSSAITRRKLTMMTCSKLLAIAKKQLGKGGAKFRAYAGVGKGGAWCDAFVYWLFNANGCGKLLPWKGKQKTYCPDSIKWCRKNLAQIPPFLAIPCDIVYFDWEKNGIPNHVGIVSKRISTSAIKTLEGNTSGGIVDEKDRSVKYVQAIFRPHFVPAKVKKCKLDESNTQFGYVTIYNLQCALGMKPTGILTKETVKYLQMKAKCTQDAVWSTGTSKAVQKMIGAKPDGAFGAKSILALKKWCNRINYPEQNKKPSQAKSAPSATTSKPNTTAKPKAPAKPSPKAYTGNLPTLNNNRKIVNSLAYRYCYPYGTPQKTYRFASGKPKPAYAKGIDEAFPNHKKWKNKKQRVGACCDILPASVLAHVGIKVPKDLKNQLTQMPKMTSQLKSNGHHKAKDFAGGDVVQRGRKDRSGHTWIVCELVNGKKYVANAHYKKLNGTYAVMDAVPKDINTKDWKYYKCYTPLGAVRTWYGVGDYGKDVLYIQQFLKWYGMYNGACNGDFTKATAEAVNKYQKSLGWTPVGRVGKNTIEAMKKARK